MQPFVLLTCPRSGSTVLTLALRELKNVYMGGEFFNDLIEYRKTGGVAPDGNYYHDGSCGKEFLERSFLEYFDGTYHVAGGFKLFLNQARTANASSVWAFLEEQREFKIVQLLRKNLFASYVSLQAAFKSDVWALHVTSPLQPDDSTPLTIDPLECEAFFDHTIKSIQVSGRAFANHNVLELYYEDDIDQKLDVTVKRIAEFVGCKAKTVKPSLRKQANLPLSQRVSNFSQIRQHFLGTRYESWFD